MTRALAAELFKLRTTRSFFWLTGSLLAIAFVVAIPVCAFPDYRVEGPQEALLYVFGTFAQALSLLLGTLAVTTEFRHGTITPTLLVVPNRLKLLGAKLTAALLVGAALGLVVSAMIIAIVAGIGSARDFDTSGDKLGLLAGATLSSALFALLGIGVGALVRNQIGAIVGSLLYIFVGEGVISILFSFFDALDDIMARYSLGAVSNALAGVNPFDADQLDQVPAGALLTLYAAIFLVAGTLLMRRRDVTA